MTVLEPPLDDLLDDLPEAQSVRADWRKGFEALCAKAQAGDAIGATRLFYELANDPTGISALAKKCHTDDGRPSVPMPTKAA